MKDLNDTLNDLLSHTHETGNFFTHTIEQKKEQIEARKQAMLMEIDAVKERYGRDISNDERELENLYTWANKLGLKQVVIDTGGLEKRRA